MLGAIFKRFFRRFLVPPLGKCMSNFPSSFNPLQTFFLVSYTSWGIIGKINTGFVQYQKYI
uniref:Uncharacterized protein n=1 Tax=Anguilla anguilla TaxID=7936 RepID=A0A0E9PGS1_ANGAN